jgi:hypothetical protein
LNIDFFFKNNFQNMDECMMKFPNLKSGILHPSAMPSRLLKPPLIRTRPPKTLARNRRQAAEKRSRRAATGKRVHRHFAVSLGFPSIRDLHLLFPLALAPLPDMVSLSLFLQITEPDANRISLSARRNSDEQLP